ncbi:hypothetical protein GCM10020367_20690 [Streptomyces sannanensis]|uniref:Helix-turn-helix domain-containing protein n=1 Tax=Streptomyces sannanensis TaxID=285536 RepID=A0ABP6S9D1_9ACTN
MSIRLMIAAAYLPPEVVNPTEKLALMKLADSADEDTRLSTPTQRRLVAWVGVGEKRVSTVLTHLVAKGLIERVNAARDGRAATYRIFPDGVPITPEREQLDERLQELRRRPTNPKLARKPDKPRRKPAAPARTYVDIQKRQLEEAARNPDHGAGESQAPASEAATSADERGFREGNPEESDSTEEARVSPGEPSGFPGGNPQGFAGETPSFPSFRSSPPSSSPPTPTADAAGEPAPAETNQQAPASGCPKHRTRPGANCRSCGTTPRAARERQRRANEAAARETNGQWWENWHEESEMRKLRAEVRADELDVAKWAAREALRRGREQSPEEGCRRSQGE